MRTSRILPALLALSLPAGAQLRLPAVLGDGMVLQRETRAPLWGHDAPGTLVRVEASWTDAAVQTVAAADGSWRVDLPTPDAGGPHRVTVRGSSEVVLEDVLVGEVWICSGQSNMEWPMWATDGGEDAIAAADHPRLRLFDVVNAISTTPREDCEGAWAACTPDSVRDFSSVGYWFGRDLLEHLPPCADGSPVPVGLVAPNWGGTVVESWTSREGLAAFEEFEPFFAELDRRVDGEEPDLAAAQARWWAEAERRASAAAAGWKLLGEDDWSDAPVPGTLADWGRGDFDGCAWYRRTFTLPAAMAGQELVLEIGAVDDMDLTVLDGRPVGRTGQDGQWNTPREYVLDASLTTAGEHVLAICMVDTGGVGAIGGPEGYVRLRGAGQVLDLSGTWQARAEVPLSELGAFPRQRWFHQNRPTALFNGMIAPLVPYAVRGAIWYQGESNRDRAWQYRRLFRNLIGDWRGLFGRDLVFLWVQLAPFGYRGDQGELSELREAQTLALELPRTGMAVTMDIGDPGDIHPRNKREVGRRLALWARARTYGEADLVHSGPTLAEVRKEGGALRVVLGHAEGLRTRDGEAPTCFTIAGEDRVFHPASARVDGKTVLVASPEVPAPVAVRYGWGATDEPNLENGAGLPAGSFRSDDWPMLTAPR